MRYYYLILLYVVVLHLGPLLNVFNLLPSGRTYVIVDSATLIPALLTALYFSRTLQTRGFLTKLDWTVVVYLAVSLASVFVYFWPENPSSIQAYFYGVHLFVLPMFMYFAVKMIPPHLRNRLILGVAVMNIAAMLFGFYCYYSRPNFYTIYLVSNSGEKGLSEEWQIYARMQSYFGSTAVGTVSATTIVLFSMAKFGNLHLAIGLPTMLMAATLSQQRGAIFGCGIAITYLVLLNRRYFVLKIFVLAIGLIGWIYAVNLFEERYEGTVDRIYERSTTDMLEAFVNRGYGPGLQYVYDFPLGVGLGATSSAAESAGLNPRGQVVDANFMRIAADLGVVGLAAFFLVLWTAVSRAWRGQNRYGWLAILAIVCGICLGTNTLDTHYVSHCFWMFLGLIDQSANIRLEGLRPSRLTIALPAVNQA